MSKIEEIASGWYNVAKKAIGKESPEVKALALSRIRICEKCEVRSGVICDPSITTTHAVTGEPVKGCGCPLTAKIRSKNSKCPAGKW